MASVTCCNHMLPFRLVCFERRADLEKALDKFQGKDFNGRKMELIDDSYLPKRRWASFSFASDVEPWIHSSLPL